MHARRPLLASADVQAAGSKLDLVPLQIADLRGAQAMTIREQDHRRIAVAVTASFSRPGPQALDLSCGEIFPVAGNCGIYGGWRHGADSLSGPENPLSGTLHCGIIVSLFHSVRASAPTRHHYFRQQPSTPPTRSRGVQACTVAVVVQPRQIAASSRHSAWRSADRPVP